jgi:hypothetical protein
VWDSMGTKGGRGTCFEHMGAFYPQHGTRVDGVLCLCFTMDNTSSKGLFSKVIKYSHTYFYIVSV